MREARDTSNSAGTEGVERRDSYGSAMNDEGKRLRLIRMKHKYREHFVKRLFDGAGPVFVAAIINRSVVAVITAIVGNSRSANRDEIVVNFVYALFVAHLLCVCIAVFVPDTYPLFTYYFRVAIETCGFAWNSTATLIVFKWLYNDQTHNPTLSIAAWLVIVFVVFTLVLVVTYVVHTCVKPSRDVHRRLDTIMTEVCSQRIVCLDPADRSIFVLLRFSRYRCPTRSALLLHCWCIRTRPLPIYLARKTIISIAMIALEGTVIFCMLLE
jgi:hypothetical protein